MEKYNNLIEAYKEAEMLVIGIGSELCKKAFEDDNKRISVLNEYNKILDKKNYLIVVCHL